MGGPAPLRPGALRGHRLDPRPGASPYKAAYVSAKHGVLGLVRTLALEGAQDEISVTAVCPGYVRTPLVEGQIADQAKVHGLAEEEVLEQVILAPHAVKRDRAR